MLRKHRYGFAAFVLAAILITLFPPIYIAAPIETIGAGEVETVTKFISLFRFLGAGSWAHMSTGIQWTLITFEYILAALGGMAVEVALAFIRRKEA